MRTLTLALLLALPLPLGGASSVLENDEIRLEVSPLTGSITHLVDKRNQTDYIKDQTQTRLFRFLLPKPDYLARRINSHEQKVESIELKNGILTIRYRQLQISRQIYIFQVGTREIPQPQLDIDVTVVLRLEGEHILAKLSVENRSLEEITDVTFPWLGGLASTAGEQSAKSVLPSLSQKSFSKTVDVILAERAKTYPGLLATTWINYEFQDKGVGIEVKLPLETQDALLSLNPNVFAGNEAYGGASGSPYIAWNCYPHVSGQSKWDSPEIVIHVHNSDWHAIASEHREWYRKHFEPPSNNAFDHSIGYATYRLKKDDNTVNWTYDEIPRLAEDARAAGIRHLVIDGWREREGPGNASPFAEIADPRMGGGSRLRLLIDELQRKGVELAFTFHPTLINTAAKEYQDGAFRWAVKSRRQGNQLSNPYTYITQDYPYQDYAPHYWVQLDPASKATDFLLREASRLRDEYGFRNLVLKGVGVQSFLSYNRDDVVPPQKVYVNGYTRLLGGLRQLFPQGVLLMEGFNDLVNQYGTGGYTWNQDSGAEILALSIPWTPFSNDVEALDYGQANASFARKVLINLVVDGGEGSVSRYAEFARHLKQLQLLKDTTNSYYAGAEFRDHEHLKNWETDSDVLLSVFENRSTKQTGVVLASLANQKKKASFTLDLKSMATKAHLYRLDGEQEEHDSSQRVSLELAPYEVVILGINPSN